MEGAGEGRRRYEKDGGGIRGTEEVLEGWRRYERDGRTEGRLRPENDRGGRRGMEEVAEDISFRQAERGGTGGPSVVP